METLIFGRAVERASQPERYIVGCLAPDQPIDARLAALLGAFGCPILPMRYESAELAKISINMCLVASVTVANTLAELCERIGADWSEIVPALQLDRRIGPYSYLKPGLGLSGGNLERDLATVERLAAEQKTDASIVHAWTKNSRHRKDWAARIIRTALLDSRPNAIIAVWGLAYKENTHSIKNSPSIATIAQLKGIKVRAHDPSVSDDAIKHLGIERVGDPLAAARGADGLLILTPWAEYRAIRPEDIAGALSGRIVRRPILHSRSSRVYRVPAALCEGDPSCTQVGTGRQAIFPKIPFCEVELAVDGWRAIRSTVGVTDIVCFSERPAPLPAESLKPFAARKMPMA